MLEGATIFRLGLAALVSGSAAGVMLALCLAFFSMFVGPGGASDTNMLPLAVWLGVQAGAVLATLPSFLAGAAMTGLAVRCDAARRAPAWAGAGALVGLGFWLLAEAALGSSLYRSGPVPEDAALLAPFLLGGAASALVFRGVMRLTGRLCVTGDPWPGSGRDGR